MSESMAEKLDAIDETPKSALAGRIDTKCVSLSDVNVPCDATLRITLFFDAFARNKEVDKDSGRFSNIARMFEAAREMRSKERPSTEYWLRFYYSGLGSPLNDDVENNIATNIAYAAAVKAGKAQEKSSLKKADQVGMVHDPRDLKKVAKKAAMDIVWHGKPASEVFDDLERKAFQLKAKYVRLIVSPLDTLERRFKAVYRRALYDIKNFKVRDLLKLPQKAISLIGQDLVIENVPILRDNQSLAAVMGSGFDTRVDSALKTVKNAVEKIQGANPRLKHVEISIFGADRGGTMAQVFLNEFIREHSKDNSPSGIKIKQVPCEIKFFGLFDCVSSIMEGNELLPMVPFVGVIKQNFKDKKLGVPSGIPALHCVAAHELRFYQRIDAVSMPSGEERLYPGSSEDVTGGAPEGANGIRTALARVPLRDMMNTAMKAGANLHSMQELFRTDSKVFFQHSLAATVTIDGQPYNVKELVDAYRPLANADRGISEVSFERHMTPFIQWLGVRSLDPVFKSSVTEPMRSERDKQKDRIKARNQARQDYDAEAGKQRKGREETPPKSENLPLIRQLAEKVERLEQEVRDNQHQANQESMRPIQGVWERLSEEAKEMLEVRQDERHDIGHQSRSMGNLPVPGRGLIHLGMTEQDSGLNHEQRRLIDAWGKAQHEKQKTQKDPLPLPIMRMFDLLVHDTMLTSWHDHILAHSLYFQTRAMDGFSEEARKKKALEDMNETRKKEEKARQQQKSQDEANRRQWDREAEEQRRMRP